MARIVIVGAGIGGLAASLALAKRGIEAVVLEQAPRIEAVGAGIQLSPNATRILHWFGLGEEMAAWGVEPVGLAIRSHEGEMLVEAPLGREARETFGYPYYHAHRADLLDGLLRRQPPGRVRLDAQVVSMEEGRLTLADGETVEADIVIGADGIHSPVRRHLFGTGNARHSGSVAWRALVPAERLADLDIPRESGVWWGPDACMVRYWVAAGRLMNWIAIARTDRETPESWSRLGRVEDAAEAMAPFPPTVTRMVERTETVHEWALFDREGLPVWTRGRVTLLGDAAHAMMPYHAQGAAMSLEDAWVLAGCLEEDMGEDGLARYEALRRERANRVQAWSRAVERHCLLADPAEVAVRNAKLAKDRADYRGGFPPGQIWLYGYDAEAALS
ncbi:MAG: FAD-dependent monooxygenase, partial [Alphaproteobacteria bacterium]|nr:FAD-dependent monooxygenase [Alphaproteobacteria bacterium]